MTNSELLDAKIEAAGLTAAEVAEKAGITRQSFWSKRKGDREFRQSEIQAITDILNLSFDEQTAIFFAN